MKAGCPLGWRSLPTPTSIPAASVTPGQGLPGPWKPSQDSRPTGGPPQLRHPSRGRLSEAATARTAARMERSPLGRVAALNQRPPPPARLTGHWDPLLSGHCFVGILSQSSGCRRPPGTSRGAATGQLDGDARPRDPPGAAQLTAAPAPALDREFPRPRPLGHAPKTTPNAPPFCSSS